MAPALPGGSVRLASTLDDHCTRLSACRSCGLPPGVSPIVSSARSPRAMLVGQAPGKVEMGGGKAFAGRAGGTLFRWLERAGLSEGAARDVLYIAAITRCYPGPHASGRGDRVPSPAERSKCNQWLARELVLIRPRILIPVGRLAIDRFLGPRPLSEVVGLSHEIRHEGGTSIAIPLPHPSGASSWVNAPEHRALLDSALELLREQLRPLVTARLGVA